MAKKTIYDFATNKLEVRDLTSEEQKARDAVVPDAEIELANLRAERNKLLFETDWWGASDLTITDAQKTYRQDLRDITKTFKSLSDKDFKFPTKPS
jgi:hypothetical protein|tara:strand:+ start:2789 stop:3076 length:288 start_codon:yes stop_codon:yes gene_type:complete